MKRQFRDFRVHALSLVIVAAVLGCATNASRPLPDLGTRQTMAMVRAGQFAELDRDYAAIQAGYDKGSISDERLPPRCSPAGGNGVGLPGDLT